MNAAIPPSTVRHIAFECAERVCSCTKSMTLLSTVKTVIFISAISSVSKDAYNSDDGLCLEHRQLYKKDFLTLVGHPDRVR